MADCVVLGGINFSRIQAGQQRVVRFRVANPGPSQMVINNISLNIQDLPFLLPHLQDDSIFPIILEPNTEYESVVAFRPLREGKYSAILNVSLDKARAQQINLYGECELPTSPSQIIFNGHRKRSSNSPLTEHGTYFDYSPKSHSPSHHVASPPTHHFPAPPPVPANTPATPYVKTEPHYVKTDTTPYLKTDNFYTRYNHVAGRAQNGWDEGGKDLETGPVTEVVPYLSDSSGNLVARFESRLSKLEQNVTTYIESRVSKLEHDMANLLHHRPQLHSDESGEKGSASERKLDEYPFQTPVRSGSSGDISKKNQHTLNQQMQQNQIQQNQIQQIQQILRNSQNEHNFTWSTLSTQSTQSNSSNRSTKSNVSDRSTKSDRSDKSNRSSGSTKSNKSNSSTRRDAEQVKINTPYKPHQEHYNSDISDNEPAKTPKKRYTTPYKPKREDSFISSSEDELGSSHRDIMGSWIKGEEGEGGHNKYDDQLELVKSNSDRKYGEFASKMGGYTREDGMDGKTDNGEPVRSGKPVPQSFVESNGNGRNEDQITLTDEDKALLKEMESSPTKDEGGSSNWRDFITATPYTKNLPTLYQNSPVSNTPLPKRVHFGDGYSSA